MSTHENNKRIAKNTLMLYARMLLVMAVSLYTSRVILATLGVENYGIYNVVGGVVVLFSFFNSALSTSTQRFLNFELGRNDIKQVQHVFSMSLIVYFCLSVMVFIVAETLGLWFLNTKLSIPGERMNAANWVYQFSVATTVLGILRVPYNAMIIAHERMSFFAYLGIGEVLCKLGVVFLVVFSALDKLVLYAGLLFCSSILIALVCVAYSHRSFESARCEFFYDQNLFYKMMSFSGWNLVGGVANMCNTQGVNMVMNIFCGVTVNAAMGIANQVNGAIYQFVTNFQTAFTPQIVKYYAADKKEEMEKLVFRASKISFFLMSLLALPVIVNIDFILGLWLKIVPNYAPVFVCLTLGYCLVDSLSLPIYTIVNATGKIRSYQLIIGTFFILNLPLAYYLLSLGLSPTWVLFARLVISFLMIPVRLCIVKKNARFPMYQYLVQVFCNVACVFIIATIPAYLLAGIFSGWTSFFVSSTYSSLAVLLGAYFLGLNAVERSAIITLARQKVGVAG